MADYPIFMAMADRVGHDKRGNTLFRRDKHGNEILESVIENIALDGTHTSQIESKKKVVDDQTSLVADTFKKWHDVEGLIW